MVLPPLPAPPPVPSLAQTPTLFARRFAFTGNTVFSDQELATVAAPYTGRTITSDELQELRSRLVRHYVERGYINSGAVLPDQQVVDGVVLFQIIEGTLTGIRISGLERFQPGFFVSRLQSAQGAPLNIFALQDQLKVLLRSDLVDKIQAQIQPGIRRGEAVLDVTVREARPFQAALQLANDHSPSSGSLYPQASLSLLNLTGWGDTLALRGGLTDGAEEYRGELGMPVNARDTTVRLFYSHTTSSIIEEPFTVLDIESRSDTIGLAVGHPLVQTASQELRGTVSAEQRHNETFLLGMPFSLYAGYDNGEIDITVGRLAADWVQRWPDQVLAARLVLSQGLDALGATDTGDGVDTTFTAWLAQAQLAKHLGLRQDDQLIVKADCQLAGAVLPAPEKFAVGGTGSVRGYRQNQLVRDNGLVFSMEYRLPLFRLPLPGVSAQATDGLLQLAPFYDLGASWSDTRPAQSLTISGAGAGLRWDPSPNLHAELYLAKALRDIDNPSSDPQDSGIHFLFRWQM
ncbi:MAG: ShlB/FhaC/HecB family hemolysin secretion/activation protein [Thermodesulfobacteriota bacterium]